MLDPVKQNAWPFYTPHISISGLCPASFRVRGSSPCPKRTVNLTDAAVISRPETLPKLEHAGIGRRSIDYAYVSLEVRDWLVQLSHKEISYG